MSVVQSAYQNKSNSNSFQNSNYGFTNKSDINHNPNTTNRMNSLSGTSRINPIELGYQPKEDTSTFRVNPMIFQSILEKTDVDRLEEDLAREIQIKKCSEDKKEVNKFLKKIFFSNKKFFPIKIIARIKKNIRRIGRNKRNERKNFTCTNE